MSSKNNKTKNTLTLLEKREICVLKQSKPTPTNKDLAIRFKIHENTVSNILKRKSEYLNVNPEDSISHNKRLRHAKYSRFRRFIDSFETLLNFLTYPPEKLETSTKQISTIRSVRNSILSHKSSLAQKSTLEEYINFDNF